MDTASLTVAPEHQNHRQQTVHTERDHSQPVRSREREGGREGRRDEEVGQEGERERGRGEKWMIITTRVQLYTYMYNSYFTSLFIRCRPF